MHRCMEHTVHLGSQKFVKEVSPTAGSAILRKVRRAFNNAKQGDTYDFDQLDVGLRGCKHDDDGDTGDDDESDDFDTGDACGKALALVKQVCVVIYI